LLAALFLEKMLLFDYQLITMTRSIVINKAVYIQIQLEIAHAFPYTITILHVQGCVTKVMVIRIHSLMKTQYIGYHKKGIKVKTELSSFLPISDPSCVPSCLPPQNVSASLYVSRGLSIDKP
jgi:hypothetical protein